MSNGRDSDYTPEQQLRENDRQAEYRNTPEYNRRMAEEAEDAERIRRVNALAERKRALQQEAIMISKMSNEWLAQNTDFMPPPDMIPANTTIAYFDNRTNEIVKTKTMFNQYNKYYMGNQIIAVERPSTGGRRTRLRRRRSRKSKRKRF